MIPHYIWELKFRLNFGLHMHFDCFDKMESDSYLIRVVLQRAVVTVVPNTVSVCVPLVHVVNIWAIVVFV